MCLVNNPSTPPPTPAVMAPGPQAPPPASLSEDQPELEANERSAIREEGTGKELRNTAKYRRKPKRPSKSNALQISQPA